MRRRTLRPILREANKIEAYRGKSKLKYHTLIVQGKSYTTKNLDQLPQDLNPDIISCNKNDNTFMFFGEHLKPSNFHDAPFVMNNTTYANAEQSI